VIVRASKRIASTKPYPFAEIDRLVAQLRKKGIKVIDFGVGDPTEPTPSFIRESLKEACDRRASSGYPSYEGSFEYRACVAEWFSNRFGVTLDPEKEVCATIGAKEAVFHLPLALVDQGDVVLCPSPGYPPYHTGTVFAGGTPFFYGLYRENNFLPDLKAIPEEVLEKTRMIWVNYPNSPTGVIAPDAFFAELIEFARNRDIVIASDEAYSEIYFDEKPRSILEFSKDGVIVVQSLSKRSCMTGYRIGFVCGDERLVSLFRKVKTNIDSGTPTFIQDAAITALRDEAHVEEMRSIYKERRDILVKALSDIGCEILVPKATLYVWAKAPKGLDGVGFASKLLEPDIAVVCTPGMALGEPLQDNSNPGKDYVRFALVPKTEDVKEAAIRIRRGFMSAP
jgi:LL-diaminopimelate aminotransferase